LAQVDYFKLQCNLFRFVLCLTCFGLVAEKVESAAITKFRNWCVNILSFVTFREMLHRLLVSFVRARTQ